MRIVLGKKGDYSIRAVLHLARHYGEGRRKTREIATAMSIPQSFLSRILANLVRHGLLVAVAGQEGGYELSRPPSRISLLEVIEAAEEETELRRCILRGIPCAQGSICSVHNAWFAAQDAMVEQLKKTTIDQIAQR
ncbi:MAG: RrF2 family transcriptional regulator [Candidatus Binatia bacterium]